MLDHSGVITASLPAIPELTPLNVAVRELDEELWSLLLKPGLLTPAEWAVIEARELAWRTKQSS